MANDTVYFGSLSGHVDALRPNVTPPTPQINISRNSIETSSTVIFDGSESTAPDGAIESYKWDFDGDGEFESSGKQVEHVFSSVGDHSVTLQVDDGKSTATTTREVSVLLLGTSHCIETAQVIDDKTVSKLQYESLARNTVSDINAGARGDDITVKTGEQALERLLQGQVFTESALNAVGESQYERSDSPKAKDYELANRIANTTIDILVELMLLSISIGEHATDYLAKHADGDWINKVLQTVGASTIDSAIQRILSYLLAFDNELKSNTHRTTYSIADDAVPLMEEGVSFEEIRDQIDDRTSSVKMSLAEGLRRNIETGQRATHQSTNWHKIEENLAYLNDKLSLQTLRTEGLAGTMDGVYSSVSGGVEDMDLHLEAAYGVMNSVRSDIEELDIIKNVQELIDAVNDNRGIDAAIDVLQTLASIISGAAAAVSLLFSAQVGAVTMSEIANTDYKTLEGIVSGESGW